jgi:hypothetical protein
VRDHAAVDDVEIAAAFPYGQDALGVSITRVALPEDADVDAVATIGERLRIRLVLGTYR